MYEFCICLAIGMMIMSILEIRRKERELKIWKSLAESRADNLVLMNEISRIISECVQRALKDKLICQGDFIVNYVDSFVDVIHRLKDGAYSYREARTATDEIESSFDQMIPMMKKLTTMFEIVGFKIDDFGESKIKEKKED